MWLISGFTLGIIFLFFVNTLHSGTGTLGNSAGYVGGLKSYSMLQHPIPQMLPKMSTQSYSTYIEVCWKDPEGHILVCVT